MGFRYSTGRLGYKKAVSVATITDPTDIAGCKLWLDFSDATTLFTDAGSTQVSSDDDLIYQANDKSGEGHNAVQATEADRPVYKTGIQNSQSIARFDGYTIMGVPAFGESITKLTIFAVIKELRANVFVYCFRSASNPICTLEITADHYIQARTRDTSSNSVTAVGSASVYNAFHVLSGVYNGTANSAYVDGSLADSDTNASYDTNSDYNRTSYIGHYQYTGGPTFEGDMAEIVIYNSPLTDTDRQSVESYLNNKWSIY
jgi:hypothetical protein